MLDVMGSEGCLSHQLERHLAAATSCQDVCIVSRGNGDQLSFSCASTQVCLPCVALQQQEEAKIQQCHHVTTCGTRPDGQTTSQ